MRLALFNPENDLALANGLSTYCPPRRIQKMAEDLQELPRLWISSETLFCLSPCVKSLPFVPESISVWGWSNVVRRRLLLLGVPERLMPSEQMLEQLRKGSHREHTISLFAYLKSQGFELDEELVSPVLATCYEQVEDFVSRHGDSVLKQPWSSSGKGLVWVDLERVASRKTWINQTLAHMQGVMCEKVYDRVLDLGVCFYIDDVGQVSFYGFSLFDVDPNGTYQGNLLLSDEEIVQIVASYACLASLLRLQALLLCYIQDQFGSFYRGYLGVDLMICRNGDGAYFLHPGVEINLRTTMGVVARAYYDQLNMTTYRGVYRILYGANALLLQVQIDQLTKQYGRVELLTPRYETTQFLAVAYPLLEEQYQALWATRLEL